MKDGDWVCGIHFKKYVVGYVTQILKEGTVVVKIMYPKKSKPAEVFLVEGFNAIPLEDYMHSDDIREMIDMALDMKDKEWFDYLVGELKSPNHLHSIVSPPRIHGMKVKEGNGEKL